MKIHENYIKRCIQLAKNGLGTTYPNPMVGCVIVHKGKIIGEGWHQKAGGPHAEVNAINSVVDKSLLKRSILYVSLEPCNHFGKTPPCSKLIVSYQIPEVVIGCLDSNDQVAGTGVNNLKENGCEVLAGILKKECVELNKRFFTYSNKKRPYIILKWAETKDGFIDVDRKVVNLDEAKPNWITNQYSRQLVHKWRAQEQAVLVGTNTAINDNPKLDSRNWFGNNPVRIVMDKSRRISDSYNLFDGSVKTIFLTANEKKIGDKSIIFEEIDFSKNIPLQISKVLYRHEIQSVIIEGGTQIFQTFVDANLWDEARIFVGEKTFSTGVNAPNISGEETCVIKIQKDVLKILKNKNC